jgi:hypothetical protein
MGPSSGDAIRGPVRRHRLRAGFLPSDGPHQALLEPRGKSLGAQLPAGSLADADRTALGFAQAAGAPGGQNEVAMVGIRQSAHNATPRP